MEFTLWATSKPSIDGLSLLDKARVAENSQLKASDISIWNRHDQQIVSEEFARKYAAFNNSANATLRIPNTNPAKLAKYVIVKKRAASVATFGQVELFWDYETMISDGLAFVED